MSTSSAAYNGSGRPVPVQAYICPSDPTNQNGLGAGWNLASYNVNGMVFMMLYPSFGASFPDGLSNTILYVEHIALCRNPAGGNNATDGRVVWPAINLTTGDPIVYWPTQSTTASTASYSGFAGFAIQYAGSGTPGAWRLPHSMPTLGTTGNCDPLTASGMHSGVVLVSMGDGSVRNVSVGVSSASWNAALSPNGNDAIGPDF